jgi:hypothetical protein
MPNLETPPQLAEVLANEFGIYGAHPEGRDDRENCDCRVCFVSSVTERIRQAVLNEHLLARVKEGKEEK